MGRSVATVSREVKRGTVTRICPKYKSLCGDWTGPL
ncbi:hypothetical protein EFR94_12080 [Levilactobacillus brevis]|nr:hypothetical protein [Levilactobacillus brevis]